MEGRGDCLSMVSEDSSLYLDNIVARVYRRVPDAAAGLIHDAANRKMIALVPIWSLIRRLSEDPPGGREVNAFPLNPTPPSFTPFLCCLSGLSCPVF